MVTRYTSLLSVMDLCLKKDESLINSFLKVHDVGYNFKKNAESFSSDELFDLDKMTKEIINNNNDPKIYENYILGYISPSSGIREQFDVLRFSDNCITNIELKSSIPKEGKAGIERQLKRHKLYLSVLQNVNISVCCFVASTNEFFGLDSSEDLIDITISEFIEIVTQTNTGNHGIRDIDLSSMIVSPYTLPEKFKNHQYFLTDEQYNIRNKILAPSKDRILLKGGNGTGKTLVLFDIAKKYINQQKKVLFIFGGPMSTDEYTNISQQTGVDLKPISQISLEEIQKLDKNVIIIDEGHRVYQNKLDAIWGLSGPKVIISMDGEQALHQGELTRNIDENVPNFLSVVLKDKIRYDPSLNSFIKRFLQNKRANVQPYRYEKVNIIYARGINRANDIVHNKYDEGYKIITPTEYRIKRNGRTSRRNEITYSSAVHDVIGREYDKVLFVIDSNYKITDGGLEGTYFTEFYPYLQIPEVLEALSRVKKSLVILIVDNPEVYQYAQGILTWKQDKERIVYTDEINRQKQIQSLNKCLKSNDEFQKIVNSFEQNLQTISHKIGFPVGAIVWRAQKDLK